MNILAFPIVAVTAALCVFAVPIAIAQQPSQFDETAIRAMQEASVPSQAFTVAVEAFEASNDPPVKAAKWEEVVDVASEGFLSTSWPTPTGGWRLIEFPESGNLSLRDVVEQQAHKVSNTKFIAQNESEAVRLRRAGSLMLGAALEGEQWGEKLLLDIAQRADSNTKRLTFWFTKHFAQDWRTKGEAITGAPVWPVDWSAWQQAYNAANPLGKAIILRNIVMLAVRRNETETAATIHVAALSGTDRELKAIALAFGDPALGSVVTAKWAEIAGNGSDQQLQSLSQEVRAKFGISEW